MWSRIFCCGSTSSKICSDSCTRNWDSWGPHNWWLVWGMFPFCGRLGWVDKASFSPFLCVCVSPSLYVSVFSYLYVLYACSFKLQHFLCFPKAVFINIGNTNLTIFMSILHLSAALSFFFLTSKAIVLKVPKVYMMHTRSKKGKIKKKQHSR